MTTNAFIWRLEGSDGKGPYNTTLPDGRQIYWEMPRRLIEGLNHPTPREDGIKSPDGWGFNGSDWHFGFCELSQAREWWDNPSDEPLLKSAGVHLVAYDRAAVRERLEGGHQVAFVTPAKPVARLAVCVLWAFDDATITQLAADVVASAQHRLDHIDRPPNRLPEFA